ncbi:MAG: DUF4445 domain-containing protein, partial [Planctomycetes bacterium]|nr:DUF4445 domain-containing protein [Planctomycetota bacterium]
MSRETFRITFQPEGQNVFVLQGTTLVEAAGQAGIIINTPCGGEGTCGKCKIEVRGDAPPPSEADKRHFNDDDLGKGMRLACQLNVDRNLVVSIPEETRFFEQVVLTEGKEHAVGLHPKVRKCYLKLAPPSQDDLRSDVDRVKEAVSDTENVKLDIALIQTMPQTLRNEEFSVTAVLDGNEIVALEKGDTTNSLWGVAFDIGTTTIVGTLVDLQNGKRKAVAGRSNPQVHFGDDVVSRINYARENEDGLQTLHTRLVICLNEIIQELCSESGIPSTDIYEITAVGNTTMTHILLEIDPCSIGQAPYVSVFREAVDVKARRLNIEVNRNANLHVLPNIAGFVGSDTVAMALASRINHSEKTLLAIDVGTNGEILIGNKDRCIACSTAAGPAFEGARIHFGMRATEGAISKVVANEEIEVSVIGGGRARGICGSGLLDAVAELLRVGVIDKSGRIQMAEKLPETVPEKVAGAITDFDGQPAFELVNAKDSKLDQAIVLT